MTKDEIIIQYTEMRKRLIYRMNMANYILTGITIISILMLFSGILFIDHLYNNKYNIFADKICLDNVNSLGLGAAPLSVDYNNGTHSIRMIVICNNNESLFIT